MRVTPVRTHLFNLAPHAWRQPLAGLVRLCASLAGREPPVLDADLMDRIRRAAGLVTHPAAVTGDLTSAVEALRGAGAGLVALFGPEHGVRGEAPDGRPVPSYTDARSGLPVYSLYQGGPEASHAPSPELLRKLAVLLVDLQDVGARFYTFASTLSRCMEAAAIASVPVVVLDRPNPLGDAVEGPLLRPEFSSFVGLHPLPIRHGCSIGELALLFHRAFGVGEEPAVVSYQLSVASCQLSASAKGPGSELTTDNWQLATAPWVPPSPNMPAPTTALVYPGMALLEGTNVSEGRGTAKPFEWLGAPWVDADALAERLRADDLTGAAFRPIHFIPSASKWAGETCAGLQVHVTDVVAFRPVLTGVAVLSALRKLWPAQFAWRQSGGFFIDRLAGTVELRLAVDRGEAPAAIAATWREDEAAFVATRAAHLGTDGVMR
jgi:uncharacterized protein YbbC (DUF1343 family)